MVISRQLLKINKKKVNMDVSNVGVVKSTHASMWVVQTACTKYIWNPYCVPDPVLVFRNAMVRRELTVETNIWAIWEKGI